MFRYDDQLGSQLIDKWNKKIRSLRIIGGVVAILMIILAIYCIFNPIKLATFTGLLIGAIIVILGIYQIVDYLATPSFIRYGGNLLIAVANILIGILFMMAPTQITIWMFGFILGVALILYGINKLMFSYRLSFFEIADHGWVSVSGILALIAGMIILIAPMLVTVIFNYLIAGYLLVGGINLLVEVIEMNNLRL